MRAPDGRSASWDKTKLRQSCQLATGHMCAASRAERRGGGVALNGGIGRGDSGPRESCSCARAIAAIVQLSVSVVSRRSRGTGEGIETTGPKVVTVVNAAARKGDAAGSDA